MWNIFGKMFMTRDDLVDVFIDISNEIPHPLSAWQCLLTHKYGVSGKVGLEVIFLWEAVVVKASAENTGMTLGWNSRRALLEPVCLNVSSKWGTCIISLSQKVTA